MSGLRKVAAAEALITQARNVLPDRSRGLPGVMFYCRNIIVTTHRGIQPAILNCYEGWDFT